jgi:hypothetical protein
MDKVYGDHIHQNLGHHLDGDVSDDTEWQNHWRHLLVYPSHTYDAAKGKVGRRFVKKVADLMESIQRLFQDNPPPQILESRPRRKPKRSAKIMF